MNVITRLKKADIFPNRNRQPALQHIDEFLALVVIFNTLMSRFGFDGDKIRTKMLVGTGLCKLRICI